MEGNELTSVLSLLTAMETVSGLSSDPLFCSIVALCSLILLYLPQLVLSPALIITGTILITLAHLLASPRNQNRAETEECDSVDEEGESVANFEESFVEWNVRAPLEVIYEEEEEERRPTLSLYYSDSDTSSDGGFWWDEEDREGLIEIALDGKRTHLEVEVEEDYFIEIDLSPPRPQVGIF